MSWPIIPSRLNRAAIGVNDPCPDDLQAILPVSDLGVVHSNHPRSLGNQKIFACGLVFVDVRADQRFHLAGQIGIDSLLENRPEYPSPFSVRISQAAEYAWILIIIDSAPVRLLDKGLFACLFVLQGHSHCPLGSAHSLEPGC